MGQRNDEDAAHLEVWSEPSRQRDSMAARLELREQEGDLNHRWPGGWARPSHVVSGGSG